MKLPPNITEEQFVETVKNVAQRLAHKFRFGFFEKEDIEQQAAIICIEALEKWDGKRPLENFLWTCTSNRLKNFKRDEYERLDRPCLKCPLYDKTKLKEGKECTKYENKDDCELFVGWQKRNEIKKNLVNSLGGGVTENLNEFHEDDQLAMDRKGIIDLIDKHLPIELREDYVKFTHGIRLHKIKEQVILEVIKGIITEHGIEYDL